MSGNRVRKIDASGIISTVAGTGSAGFNGDGSLATATQLDEPAGVAVDILGNLYIAESSGGYIRKVNSSGIINIIAGSPSSLGYSGDGGPAMLAGIPGPVGVAVDHYGNIYIAEYDDGRIRYIRNTVSVPTTKITEANVVVSPNPNNGHFKISVKELTAQSLNVTVTDITGREIKKIAAESNQEIKMELNVAEGLYFLNVATTSSIWTEKLLIKK
jgi:hypothetical protein